MMRASGQSRPRRHGQAGFTLVEMIVATIILVIGVAATMAAVSASTESAYASEHAQTAALLARQQLAQLELQFQSGSGPTSDQSGDFGQDYPDYHWQAHIQQTDYTQNENLYEVTLTVQWGANDARPHQAVFDTFMVQAQQNQNGSTSGTGSTQGSSANGGG